MKALKYTFVWFTFLTAALPASGRELAIELTKDAVPITANFVGSDLMLYGASEDGGDVLVVVRGPNKDQTVRRKKKSAIICFSSFLSRTMATNFGVLQAHTDHSLGREHVT